MSNRKWFQLNSSLIEVYTQSDISYKFKKLPLEYFYITTAKFSGPIAILYNKFLAQQVQLKLSPNDENSIMIFNPKGELKKTIPFELKDRVILFRFTELEQLMLLYASGEYVLIDPFSGKKYTGTFFIGQDEINKTTNQRCVAAVMTGDSIFVMRQRQLGIVKNFKTYWTALPNLKPNTQNPIFTVENISVQEMRQNMQMMSSDGIGALVYLSKENAIEEYSVKTNIKRVLFDSDYVRVNYKNLMCMSKRKNVLVLVFRSPFKLFYIHLASVGQLPSTTTTTTKFAQKVTVHQPLLQLNQRPQISKKKSKHNYMSLNHEIGWLCNKDSNGDGDITNIAAYSNGKLFVIFDPHSVKAIYNYHVESKTVHSIIEQIDGLRVIGEQHTLYRRVNMIYQQLVSLESLEQAQNKIFASTPEMQRQKHILKQKLMQHIDTTTTPMQQSSHQPPLLSMRQKVLIIHELHQLYKRYINKQMIPINQLNELKTYAGQMLKEVIENGIMCLDKLELIKILKFATFVQNYFMFSTTRKDNSSSSSGGSSVNIGHNVHNRHSDQRLSQFKQLQLQQSIIQAQDNNTPGAMYSFLSTPIHQLCSQLRILNTLKYSSMKRFLTIEQFHFLKYDNKEEFIDILLRYNMHYELDLIFGDSQAKAKLFYHWAKCRIQKELQQDDGIQRKYTVANQSQLIPAKQSTLEAPPTTPTTTPSDNLVFQTIIQKYDSMKDKFAPNNQLFSQLAKYCVDRNKLTLGVKLLEYEQDPQKKALVGLLILVAKKDKHLAQKVLQFTQNSKRSPIIYRVIKQLLNLQWIEKHLWTNLFHNRLIVEEHFLKYNQFIFMYQNIKDYFLQNKMLVDLAYMGIKQIVEDMAKEIVKDLKDSGKEEAEWRDCGMGSLFNERENQEIKQKIIEQFQSLVPSMCLNLKKHTIKPKSGLTILKRFKTQPNPIMQDDVDSVVLILSDKQLQYLGQIILQRDDNKQLATYVFMRIKSQKSYRILLKQGKYKEAIDLAADRRNVEMLKEMVESIDGVTQQTDQEYLVGYAREKIIELERRRVR